MNYPLYSLAPAPTALRRRLRRASWVPATIDGKPGAAVTTAVLKDRNSMYVPEGR